jgi:signal peptidase II
MFFYFKKLFFVFLIVIIDQTTKIVAVKNLDLAKSVEVLPFFDLTLLYNHGAAFSFLANAGGWQRWFFLIIGLAAILFFLIWLYRVKTFEKYQTISLILILGGAIGNVIDRIYLGYVVDFLHFHIYEYYWPSFNIADSAIVGGVILIILSAIYDKE